MKKLLVIVLLIFTAKISTAQFSFGVKGGITTSKIYTDAGSLGANYKQSLAEKTGYVLGIWSRIGDKLYLQPEAVIASKQGQVYATPAGGTGTTTVNIKSTNLDVPVLVGYKPAKFLRIYAGPVASIKLHEDQGYANQLKDIMGDVNSAFQNASIGYQAGIGINVIGLNIDLRKDGSISDISNKSWANDAKYSQRISGWQLAVGFKIL